MRKRPLTDKQQRLMIAVRYAAQVNSTAYFDIGKHGQVKTITEIHNLVKRGEVEIVERGAGWVRVRAVKPAEVAPTPDWAAGILVANLVRQFPRLAGTGTDETIQQMNCREGATLAEIWAQLSSTVQQHLIELHNRATRN